MENSLYSNTWFDSDLDSYLMYLDGYINNGKNVGDDEPMSFDEFRESICAKA